MQKSDDSCLWLGANKDRGKILDGEILEKFVDLDNSCLTDTEKKSEKIVSLRNEIGTHPNIET